VPFFFSAPAAWCTGRGEKVAPAPLPRPLWFVLLAPPLGLATADVYRRVAVPERPQSADGMRRALAGGDVEEVGRRLHNRLQPAALALRPELADYLARLATHRPAGQAMSGSGSTLFALCRDRREAARLAGALRNDPELKGRARVDTVRSCA
jgi:4-diphosphocytidyl-2-C-methyl-D-erythritol kinase